MAFIVAAPLVSRIMPSHTAMPGMAGMIGSDCPHAIAGNDHPAAPGNPADATDRCGYCVLLDHQSLLATHAILHLLPVPPPALVSVAPRIVAIQQRPRQDARPRGPPLIA